ncbi:MAG: DUF3833 domain-containing protein [Gammaproteobacteria bacterium]|nr:DUF3833 domain-containing protein [Gammaproteobacteria bacterium]
MSLKNLAVFGAICLTGCAGVDVNRYANEQPELVLEEYFNGTLDAWGMFQKRNGEVVKRFKVVIDAKWNGEQGVLDERFTYSDGETQRRVWHLTNLGNGRYEGRADDVIGVAQGQIAGNTLHWTYRLRLPVDDSVYEVDFDDWMYLQDDGVLLNRSAMKKFGVTLGEVSLVFQKRP